MCEEASGPPKSQEHHFQIVQSTPIRSLFLNRSVAQCAKYPGQQGGSRYSFSAIAVITSLTSGGNCLFLCGAESHLNASLT